MSDRHFMDMLRARWDEGKFVCVGLDSEFAKIPKSDHRLGDERDVNIENTIVSFNCRIVESTAEITCAYKPNIAFYAAYGTEGLSALRRTIRYIHATAPDVPVILDAKRADIDNTNLGYLKEAFDFLQADAITVHPYLGHIAMQPFLDRKDKGIIVLCRTSNPGADEFQSMDVSGDMVPSSYMELYEYVAHRVSTHWNANGNCALVVGAPFPEELRTVRMRVGPDMPILIPGVGFQQKAVPLEEQVEQVVTSGKGRNGQGMIINSSRGIIFADDPRSEAENLHYLINQYR